MATAKAKAPKPVRLPATWEDEAAVKPDNPGRGGDTFDKLLAVPLARPLTDDERELTTRLLTRLGALDLQHMLLGAA